jgi:hypothetical protein
LVIAALGLGALAMRGPAEGRALLGRAAIVVLVIAPFVIWSVATFGTWMPVSARLKTSFPAVDLARSLDTIRHSSLNAADQASFALALVIAAASSLALFAGLVRHRRTPVAGRDGVMAILSVYLLARLSYMALFSRLDVQGSYAILAHVYVALAAIAGMARLARAAALPRPALIAGTAVMLVLAGALPLVGKITRTRAWLAALQPGGRGDEIALAAAIRARTSEGDVLYGGAYGVLGFFADRPWINGDGVANSYDYQRAFVEGGLDSFLVRNGVTHVVFLCVPPGPDGLVRLTATGVLYGGTGVFHAQGEPLLRWRSLRGGGADICLARYHPLGRGGSSPGRAVAPGP